MFSSFLKSSSRYAQAVDQGKEAKTDVVQAQTELIGYKLGIPDMQAVTAKKNLYKEAERLVCSLTAET
jgi:hypothetical protein